MFHDSIEHNRSFSLSFLEAWGGAATTRVGDDDRSSRSVLRADGGGGSSSSVSVCAGSAGVAIRAMRPLAAGTEVLTNYLDVADEGAVAALGPRGRSKALAQSLSK